VASAEASPSVASVPSVEESETVRSAVLVSGVAVSCTVESTGVEVSATTASEASVAPSVPESASGGSPSSHAARARRRLGMRTKSVRDPDGSMR
jgi:hypothetical protein